MVTIYCIVPFILLQMPFWPSTGLHTSFNRTLALREKLQDTCDVQILVIPTHHHSDLPSLWHRGSPFHYGKRKVSSFSGNVSLAAHSQHSPSVLPRSSSNMLRLSPKSRRLSESGEGEGGITQIAPRSPLLWGLPGDGLMIGHAGGGEVRPLSCVCSP